MVKVYDITGFISPFCFKGYGKLSDKEKVEWNNRGFSTFHALIAAWASLYLLIFSDLFDEDSSNDLIKICWYILARVYPILGISRFPTFFFLSLFTFIVFNFSKKKSTPFNCRLPLSLCVCLEFLPLIFFLVLGHGMPKKKKHRKTLH
ncbi:hypothetical protein V6Z11_A06G247300 [Gossypium hirsutum]